MNNLIDEIGDLIDADTGYDEIIEIAFQCGATEEEADEIATHFGRIED